jgi:hypothetical protein
MTVDEALGYFEELHLAYVNEFCCSTAEAEESEKEFKEAIAVIETGLGRFRLPEPAE